MIGMRVTCEISIASDVGIDRLAIQLKMRAAGLPGDLATHARTQHEAEAVERPPFARIAEPNGLVDRVVPANFFDLMRKHAAIAQCGAVQAGRSSRSHQHARTDSETAPRMLRL